MNLKKSTVYRFFYIIIYLAFSFANKVEFGNEIFKENYDAKNAALGGVSLYMTGGSNPAMLINHQTSFINFSYMNKFGGLLKVNSISYLHINENANPVFISLIHREVEDIPDTRDAWLDNGDSFLDQDEINYFNIKNFSQNEIGIKLSFLRKIKKIIIASSIKPSYTSLAGFSALGISSDISILKQFCNKKMDFSFRAEDIINYKYWSTKSSEYSYPVVAIGGNLNLNNFLFSFDLESQLEEMTSFNYNTGIEVYQSNEMIIFRFGKSADNLFTIGGGIVLDLFNIDYAFVAPNKDKPFEPSQILSISVKLDKDNWIKSKLSP